MKVLIILVIAAVAHGKNVELGQLFGERDVIEPLAVPLDERCNIPQSFINHHAIPLAEKIRKAEEEMAKNRIAGGSPANLGQFPYQAGLLAEYNHTTGTGVCGGSIVTPSRVITAAHCWNDGCSEAFRVTVVLGSVLLFSGGTRIQSTHVEMHPNWDPFLIRNDVAVIYLPASVTYSATIAPISLPTASELNLSFAGYTAVASGFGITGTGSGITATQSLSHVNLNILSNTVCRLSFPLIFQSSNLCTSGAGGLSTCSGDSGGPLVVTNNNRPVLVGITSFGLALGCDIGWPASFARVTSFMSFFNLHGIFA